MSNSKIYVLKNSFASGQIDQKCWYRPEYKKYPDAVSKSVNFLPHITGYTSARQGTKFIQKCKYDERKVVLGDFIYATNDNYALEIGYKYIRFFVNKIPVLVSDNVDNIILGKPTIISMTSHPFNLGTDIVFQNIVGTTELNGVNFLIGNKSTNAFILCDYYFGVREIENITNANPCVITSTSHGLVTGDVICIDDVSGTTELNGNYYTITKIDDDQFSLNGVNSTLYGVYTKYGEIRKCIDSSTFTPFVSGGIGIAPYEVVTTFDEDDLLDIDWTYVNLKNLLVFACGSQMPKILERIDFDSFTFSTISFSPSINAPTNVVSGTTGGTSETYQNYITSVNAYYDESFPVIPTARQSADPLSKTQYITLSWDRNDDAIGYNVYVSLLKGSNYNIVWQVARINQPASGNISFNMTSIEPLAQTSYPYEVNYFDAVNGYPNRCCMYAERLIFSRRRATFYSCSNSPFNFSIKGNKGASDAFSSELSGKENDDILWILDKNKYLLVGTYSNIYKIYPYDNYSVESSKMQCNRETVGSTNLYPLSIGNALLFLQEYGRNINEFIYQYENNGYRSETISYFFEDLIESGVVNWSFKDDQDPWVNIITADGKLVTLIYERNQLINGAVSHNFENGFLLDCVNIPGEEGSDTYFIVQREINGKTVKYIEFLNPRFIGTELEDFWGLDCAVEINNGSPTNVLNGLGHFIGETVSVVGDLGYIGDFVVDSNGQITLTKETSYALVGYKIECELKTLPVESIVQNASLQSIIMSTKKINKARVFYKDSLGFFATTDEKYLNVKDQYEYDFVGSDDEYNQMLKLKTGYKDVFPDGETSDYDAYIYIYKNKPHPLNLIAIAMDVEISN